MEVCALPSLAAEVDMEFLQSGRARDGAPGSCPHRRWRHGERAHASTVGANASGLCTKENMARADAFLIFK